MTIFNRNQITPGIKFSGAKGVPLNLHEEDNLEININKLEKLITNKTSLIIKQSY